MTIAAHTTPTPGRRTFLRALLALGVAAPVIGTAAEPASREQMLRYYSLLWLEFKQVADELGVEMCSAMCLRDHEELTALLPSAPPSQRAKRILAAVEGR